jgi:DNA (cytosine-5)-methyltransferase 1
MADLFCGAGGTSSGAILAARELGLGLSLVAVNHWKVAVATHAKNHPWAEHICADLATVDPSKVIPSGRLDLLVASPECTHHSAARGGKPCSDQSRASAWHVLHWAERLRVDAILVENVREFTSWGPLMQNGRPDPKRKGETFEAFVRALVSLGYNVEHRVLNAADYGDATTRKRLFVQAVRHGKPHWPTASHIDHWRAAREVIDWSLHGQSIFTRKRPLSKNTLRRIEAGLKRFGGGPFLAVMKGQSNAADVDLPMPTLTAHAANLALCEPFLIPTCHTGDTRTHSIDNPVPTITCGHRGELALVEPFIVGYHGDRDATPRVHSVDEPLPTQTAENRFGLCMPFLTKYYGTAGAVSVSEPMPTVTAKDRFALVEPTKGRSGMDIRFRMLQPHELAAAMGFTDYEFAGNKTEKVRQIGNAVPVNTAKALVKAILAA